MRDTPIYIGWRKGDLGRLSWSVLVKTRQDKRHQDQASAWSCPNRLGLLRTLLHEEFSSDIMERSKAKVWTIFGKPNREWYLGSRQRLDYYEFVPPDGNTTTKFTLEYGIDNKLRRVAFFCDHPQYIYHPQDLLKGLIMDQALNLTTALAGITVKTQYLDRFYQSILKRFSTRKRRSRRYDRGEMIVASSRCLEQQQLSSRPLTFDGLDLTLRDWLQAQGVENAKDAAEWSAKQGAEKLTIVEAVHSVLLTENDEQLAGSSEPVPEHENFSETEELEHRSLSELSQIKRPGYEARRERLDVSKFRSMYRFADEAKGDSATMEVKCEKCGEVQTDDIPTYDHTGAYIVR
jgi:hypothetical protein